MVLVTQIARAFGALAVFTALLGFGYTGAVTLVGTLVWPDQAEGSLAEQDGEIVGSRLLAQPFTDPGYLWPRPSASGQTPTPAWIAPPGRCRTHRIWARPTPT